LEQLSALQRLEETLAAADVALTADDPAEIQVEGQRYPEQLMATTGR
jgi:hypothetical protein